MFQTLSLLVLAISSASILATSSKSSKHSSQNLTPRKENVDSFSISPSYSYQYYTNDHGEYDTTVSGTPRSKKKGSNDKLIQWDDFAPPSVPKFSYAASPVAMNNYSPQPVPIDSYSQSLAPRDSYDPPQAPMDAYGVPPAPSYGSPPAPSYGSPPAPSYGAPAPNYGSPPATAYGAPGNGGGSFGGTTGGFVSHAADPPPPTIKGSIDYVLIPLILIGIAGPIFVVLYVVLGAFEAKLAPITTRSNSWSDVISDSLSTLKPATDIFFVTLSNALDQNECMERTMCHIGSFGRTLGLDKLSFMNQTVEGVVREPYKRSFRMFLSSMTNKPESCSAFKCP